jgi:predicted Holliday junction resolvase-like endonuclease
VKSQKSNLIPKQRKIRDLIKNGKVIFEVLRISGEDKKTEDKK